MGHLSSGMVSVGLCHAEPDGDRADPDCMRRDNDGSALAGFGCVDPAAAAVRGSPRHRNNLTHGVHVFAAQLDNLAPPQAQPRGHQYQRAELFGADRIGHSSQLGHGENDCLTLGQWVHSPGDLARVSG
jgi:hypothetical protein